MEISVLKSMELSQKDWNEIIHGFNDSFNMDKTVTELQSYYKNNPFGYSYHAIARNEEDMICGHTTIFPYEYYIDTKKYLLGQGGGTFVLKEYRKEAFLYLDMIQKLKEYCALDGISAFYGVSNKNSFGLAIKLLGSTFIKDLEYYILPVSLSRVLKRKKLRLFDPMIKPFIYIWCWGYLIKSFLHNTYELNTRITIIDSDAMRKHRFDEKYIKYSKGKSLGVYRMYNEAGIRTAYILDFRENGRRSLNSLSAIISHILHKEDADAILFVGDLQLSQHLLVKVPKKMEPQRLPLTFDLLDEKNEELRQILAKPENWNFSLMNFDAR